MKKRSTVLIGIALLGILAVSDAGSVYYTSRPTFCNSCHKMDERYASWQAGAQHCHGEQGESGPNPVLVGAGAVSFKRDLLPVFTEKCSDCHGGVAGLTLTSYEDIMKGGSKGPIIVPGHAESSRLVEKQRGPHLAKLSEQELRAVIDWINAGAADN